MATRYLDVGGQPQQQFQGPDATKANRRLAEALVQQGMNPGKMSHWSEALGSVLQTGIGSLRHEQANADERDGRRESNRALAEMLAGGDSSAAFDNPYSADQALQIRMSDRNAARSEAAADRKHQLEMQSPEYQLNLEHKRAQIEDLKRKQSDPIEQFLLQRLQGRTAPGANANEPRVETQSYDGTGVSQGNGITPVVDQSGALPSMGDPSNFSPGGSQADVPGNRMPTAHQRTTRSLSAPMSQPGGQPQSVPQSLPQFMTVADPQGQPSPDAMPASQQDMIETPYGRMSSQEARELGGSMLLSPKYAPAGRALLDSVGSDKGGLAKPSINTLEERTLNAAAQLGRLGEIRKRYNPKFLEIPKRLEMMGLSWSSKLGQQLGGKLNPAQEKELREYASFRSTTLNNFNTILKELSGTAVSAQEFLRIQNEQPTAGTGLFDGDDPVSFDSKMSTSEQLTRSAIARYNFMRSRGLNFTKDNIEQFMSLDDVPAAYERRGAEIEQQIRQRQPQIQPQALEEMTTRQLKREWGI